MNFFLKKEVRETGRESECGRYREMKRGGDREPNKRYFVVIVFVMVPSYFFHYIKLKCVLAWIIFISVSQIKQLIFIL